MHHLVIDLTATTFIDLGALRRLLATSGQWRRNRLLPGRVRPPVLRILQITQTAALLATTRSTPRRRPCGAHHDKQHRPHRLAARQPRTAHETALASGSRMLTSAYRLSSPG